MAILSRFLAAQFARPSGWLGRHLIGPWLDRISGPMNDLALAELDLQKADDVLEVGFGGGALLAMIAGRTTGRVSGVDISPQMVERARRRFRRMERVRLFHASVQKLPVADRSVDKACSVNNLYFSPDPPGAIGELARVVPPGRSHSTCFEPPEALSKWPGHRFGFRLFAEAEVKALMEKGGFGSVRRAQGLGRKPDVFLCLTGERVAEDAAT